MSPEDTALFEQAKNLYNTGKKQEAYQQFREIYDHGNEEHVSLLCWIGYSTPDLEEAGQALANVERLKPNHLSLPKLRNRIKSMQPQTPYTGTVATCPYCHRTGPLVLFHMRMGGQIPLRAPTPKPVRNSANTAGSLLEISDPAQIRCYPGVVAALDNHHIAMEMIRYIRIQHMSRATEAKTVREVHVTVTLHSGEKILVAVLPQLIWRKPDTETKEKTELPEE